MGYCHNCGKLAAPEDMFCESCGTHLELAEPTAKNVEYKNTYKRGYVFTNIEALSHKLHVKSNWIEDQILKFIEAKRACGVIYSLIDTSNYKPKLSVNKANKISLSPSESWMTHQRLLTDNYVYDTEQMCLDVDYLFIIGGHDIIPVPVVKNHMPANDPSVDTDLPYAYLYGQQTQELLESSALFYHSPMLHVGRLPLAKDAVSEDLIGYLNRDLQISQYGFPDGPLYGQCDPNWKKVSGYVIDEILPKSVMSDESRDYLYRSLVLTPHVTITKEEYHPSLENNTLHLERFFNENAVLYYFNMHGANFPTSPYFFGNSCSFDKEEETFPGIAPHHMTLTQRPNIIVTEACYGARFIGGNVDDSMLLSAMRHLTMIYLGSSRTSVGAGDRKDDVIYMSYADVIARCFIGSILGGLDAAQALFFARQQTMQNASDCPATHMTISEFNLFGDPTLTFEGVNTKGTKSLNNNISKNYTITNTLIDKKDYSPLEIKEINISKPESILDKVRQAVNKNIDKINEKITTHLYDIYGITPRKLSHVFEIKTNRSKSHIYIYSETESRQVWVKIDEENKIKSVSTTK